MEFKNNILYASTACSPRVLNYIFRTSNIKPSQAIQKFHRLMLEGFSMNEKCQIETLSSIPVITKSHKKRFWKVKSEIIGQVKYNYIPFINLPILKDISIMILSFFKIIYWSMPKKRTERVVICDILNLSITISSLIACKLTRTKIIAIITDIPGLMLPIKIEDDIKTTLFNQLTNKTIANFSGYILLTEQMNEIVNRHNRPFMILEGLVDVKMNYIVNSLNKKDQYKIIIYAGAIYEKYGVKKLIQAFIKLDDDNLRLHIYGSGDMEKEMHTFMNIDNRIIYKGLVPNYEVVNRLQKATLLINPRPTSLELAKFSFPSKNLEYMVSGTPIVTTRLLGMPKDHYKYVYFLNDESVGGIYKALKFLLSKPNEELHEFGCMAKKFVLKNKNNIIQSKRVLSFIKDI